MSRITARTAAMQLIYEKLSGGQGGEESLRMVYDELRQDGVPCVFYSDYYGNPVQNRPLVPNLGKQIKVRRWYAYGAAAVAACLILTGVLSYGIPRWRENRAPETTEGSAARSVRR